MRLLPVLALAAAIAADGATITFPPDSLTEGRSPGMDCTIPLDTLRPFLRAGTKLW